MIEIIVLEYLKSTLNVNVYAEVEENMPNSYVLIEKTSGSSNNKLRSAVITIQSYAESMYKSALLNEKVVNAMEMICNTQNVGSCKLNSDYNYTDTSTKKYRYQAVFELVY